MKTGEFFAMIVDDAIVVSSDGSFYKMRIIIIYYLHVWPVASLRTPPPPMMTVSVICDALLR